MFLELLEADQQLPGFVPLAAALILHRQAIHSRDETRIKLDDLLQEARCFVALVGADQSLGVLISNVRIMRVGLADPLETLQRAGVVTDMLIMQA